VTDDSEKIELRKKIAQAEKRLCAAQAKIAGINQRVANFEKAEAALMKFYTRGPHKKKKSGRPTFWKSPHGLFFVQEVERIAKERKCKTATAIRAARTATIRWAEQAEARGIKGPVIARAARLARLTDDAALQSRYQEVRKFWLFLVDPEAYRREQEILEYNFQQALAALQEGPARNPYDFS
jgi:hypothetical protein